MPALDAAGSPERDAAIAQVGTLTLVGAGVLAVAIVSLFLTLNPSELWLDETHTALLSKMSVGRLLDYVKGDVHPPLYFILINQWQHVFGDSPVALRSFSAVAHLAGTFFFFEVCFSAYGNRRLALCGAALFLLSPALIHYATEARMYSLAVLFVVLMLERTVRVLKGDRSLLTWISLSLFSALATYTHYATLFFVAGAFAFLLIYSAGDRFRFRRVLMSGTLFAALVLPWSGMIHQQRQAKAVQSMVRAESASDTASLAYGAATNSHREPGALVRRWIEDGASLSGVLPGESLVAVAVLALPIAAVLCFALIATATTHKAIGLLLCACAASSVAGTVFLGLNSRRYVLWLAPVSILLLLLGLVHMQGRIRRSVVVAGAMASLVAIYAAGVVRMALREKQHPWGKVVELIGRGFQKDDLVLVSVLYAQAPFDYYASRARLQLESHGFPEDLYVWWERQSFKGWGSPDIRNSSMDSLRTRVNNLPAEATLWFIEYEPQFYDPRGRIPASMREYPGWTLAACALSGNEVRLYSMTRKTSLRRHFGCSPES